MISVYYGKNHSLQAIKENCSISRLGITVADILKCCNGIGFNAAAVKGTLKQLQKVPLPLILYWRQSHYVVLYKIKCKKNRSFFYIADPAFGKIKLTENEFEQQWLGNNNEGIAMIVKPSDEFYSIPVAKQRNNYAILRELLAKYKKYSFKLFFSILLLALTMLFNWAIPIIFQQVIDNGVNNKDIGLVYKLMMVQLAFFVGYMLSNNLSSILLMKSNFKISIEYLSELLGKIIKLPVKFFDTRLNTDLIQRMEDQARLQSFLTFRVIEVFFAIVNLIVFSSLLAYYNRNVFYIFCIISVLSLAWTFYFLKKRKYLDYSRFSAQSENKNNIYELISGMTEIKVNNAQSTRINVWKKTQQKINNIALNGLYLNYYQLMGSSFFNRLKDILITIICAYLVIKDEMTFGIMMSISYILGQLTGPINQMSQLSQGFQDAKISLDRLSEIQSKQDENTEGMQNIQSIQKSIDISDISFKYEGSFNRYVLDNLSLTIKKGEITAIVGNSGSGKTTLLKLLLGFYYPQEGKISVNGIEIKHINSDQWRNMCGVVMQEGYIFSGTIAENIAIADEEIDFERIIFSAKVACIDDFIVTLPNKYLTQIGKSGIDLSGGQKQRILIARAVYKNPEILLFDEATSHLDSTNEKKIMDNLQSFFKGKTVVIVAHRLSTVANANNIIFLENGHIMEQGTHSELWKNKGHYYNLVKNQLELEV